MGKSVPLDHCQWKSPLQGICPLPKIALLRQSTVRVRDHIFHTMEGNCGEQSSYTRHSLECTDEEAHQTRMTLWHMEDKFHTCLDDTLEKEIQKETGWMRVHALHRYTIDSNPSFGGKFFGTI